MWRKWQNNEFKFKSQIFSYLRLVNSKFCFRSLCTMSQITYLNQIVTHIRIIIWIINSWDCSRNFQLMRTSLRRPHELRGQVNLPRSAWIPPRRSYSLATFSLNEYARRSQYCTNNVHFLFVLHTFWFFSHFIRVFVENKQHFF